MMVINAWSWYFVELLSRLVCQLTISFHTFLGMTLHIKRPRRNTKILRIWKLFCSSRWNSRFKYGSVIVHNIFAYFTLPLSASQVYMIKRRCWFSQINFFIEYFPHRINIVFHSSQFLCHPHTQIRKILFHDVQRDMPNLEFSPSHVSIGYSQIAFPTIVLPKDDSTDFAQEERLGLLYWTMIWAICVVVDESKCLDIPIFGFFSIILEHLPFKPGYKQILRRLLVHRNLAIWKWYPRLLLLSFVMLMILVRWILRKTQNRLLQYHLGVQLDPCIFGALSPIQHFSNDRCPSMKRSVLFYLLFLLHRSPLIYFWLLSGPTPVSFQFLTFFIHCCFCCGYLHGLRYRNKIVYQIVMLLWIVTLSCNMVLM